MITSKPVVWYPHDTAGPVWYPHDTAGPMWGYPNTYERVEYMPQHGEPKQLRCVLAWKVFYVQVYIRNVDEITQGASSRYWLPFATFYAEKWEDIDHLFYRDHFSAGVAHRFCWIVESWLWTEDFGWNPADNI